MLLVDDEVPFTTNMVKILSRRGYDVSAVNDGDGALRIVEEQDFDVVILDKKMPGKDGITTLRELKKKRPCVEVIILTGYGSIDSAIQAVGLGAYDYTMKPVHMAEMEEKIAEAFQRKLIQEERAREFLESAIPASPLPPPDSSRALMSKPNAALEKDYKDRCYRAEKMAAVGTIAAGVAHELNNPLTAIVGFAEGVRRQLSKLEGEENQDITREILDYVAIIRKESQRCQEIVQSLLTISHRANSELVSVDLNEVVGDTLMLLQNRLKNYPENYIYLDLSEPLPRVRGDPSQLTQVVLNLLTNAVDATQSGGHVTLSTFALGSSHVGLAVEDTGCGISQQNLDKLFMPFFTTKPPGQGTGMGLSICYNIIYNMGGEIAACSQEGIGSTFVVTLPLEDTSC